MHGQIPYTIKHSRRTKNARITVSCGAVFVTVPSGTPLSLIERWVEAKAQWIYEMIRKTKNERPLPASDKPYAQYRRRAEAFIVRKVRLWNERIGNHYERIVVRNQKTRWGSCSKTGTLSFHYQLFSLPEALADYVVVHELCHLKEMNHSRRFWKEVAEVLPDFEERRRLLRGFRTT